MAQSLLFLFVLLAVGFGILAPFLDARRSRSQQERSVALRLTMFSWLLGLLLAGGLILLPNKPRVLMLAPIFFVAVVTGRVWKSARRRARLTVDIERMKRVN